MNTSRAIIIITGDQRLFSDAKEIISGFKAVTVVNHLDETTISNVHKHNKNVVFFTPVYDFKLSEYKPIVLSLSKTETDTSVNKLNAYKILSDFPILMDSLDIDVGDHILEDSKNSTAEKNDCLFCKIRDDKSDNPEHILYESHNFYVLPGTGAFFDGYVMIVPKKHVMSFAELDSLEFEEFLQVLNDIRFILESVYYKKVFVFECGSGASGEGKHTTSIVHAHMHLAPTDMPVLENVQKSGIYPAQIYPENLRDYGLYRYKLYIDQENTWYIASDPACYYPRQHPRQILADYMGLEKGKYNWRAYPMREKMDVIAEEIYGFLRANYDFLPSWIKKSVKDFL